MNKIMHLCSNYPRLELPNPSYKQIEKRIDDKYFSEGKEMKDNVELDELKQLNTLNDLKNRNLSKAAPQERKPVAKCQACKIEFISKDILDKHVSQYHTVKNSEHKNDIPDDAQHDKPVNNIPVVANSRVEQNRPSGINIRRQYNCHECDFQANKSKILFKHSVETGHRKIDSLTETCYTCKETFDNFIVLMKHRKSAHYAIINECHSFKAGACRFGESCYYKHSGNEIAPKATCNDSFHQGLEEFPPDLKELTLGFQSLMSTFLSRREGFKNRLSGH